MDSATVFVVVATFAVVGMLGYLELRSRKAQSPVLVRVPEKATKTGERNPGG